MYYETVLYRRIVCNCFVLHACYVCALELFFLDRVLLARSDERYDLSFAGYGSSKFAVIFSFIPSAYCFISAQSFSTIFFVDNIVSETNLNRAKPILATVWVRSRLDFHILFHPAILISLPFFSNLLPSHVYMCISRMMWSDCVKTTYALFHKQLVCM